jgi:hypothetical protein
MFFERRIKNFKIFFKKKQWSKGAHVVPNNSMVGR